MKNPKSATIVSGYFSFSVPEPFQPQFSSDAYLPKKGRKMVYFRFLIAQNATMPTTAIMATAISASSVVVKTNSSASGSGSIGCASDGAGSTVKYVEADDSP